MSSQSPTGFPSQSFAPIIKPTKTLLETLKDNRLVFCMSYHDTSTYKDVVSLVERKLLEDSKLGRNRSVIELDNNEVPGSVIKDLLTKTFGQSFSVLIIGESIEKTVVEISYD